MKRGKWKMDERKKERKNRGKWKIIEKERKEELKEMKDE